MATNTALTLLRAELGCISRTLPTDMAALLQQKLDSAESTLADKGIIIDESLPKDMDLLVSYAAWLYRKRESGDELPRMLRYAINNRQTRKAVGAE